MLVTLRISGSSNGFVYQTLEGILTNKSRQSIEIPHSSFARLSPMTIRCGTGMSRLSLLRVIGNEQDSPRFNRGLPGDVDALKSEREMWMSKKLTIKYN